MRQFSQKLTRNQEIKTKVNSYFRNLDDGIAEAVISLIWVAPRVMHEITEFKVDF